MPSGSKIWEYHFVNPDTNKRDTFIIGEYPLISLSNAREIHQEKRRLVAQKINPKNNYSDKCFSIVFNQWHEEWAKEKESTLYARESHAVIVDNCMKILGHMQTNDIEPRHILQAMQPFVERGALGRIPKLLPILRQTFEFALLRGITTRNPVNDVTPAAFPKHKSKGHESLDPKSIFLLHDYFKNYNGTVTTKNTVKLLLYSTSRSQEICKSKWEYVDFENGLLNIPGYLMKKREPNIIPLPSQAMAILIEMKSASSESEYIFPGDSESGHIDTKSPCRSLRNFKLATTAHGFRTLASTIFYEAIDEHGISPLIIEACLAHKDTNRTRAAYNKATFINQRRELLQWWSDFIDRCDTEEGNLDALRELKII